MATQSLRIRLTFDDQSVLTQTQRSNGMNNSWFLIEPNQHSKIADVCNHVFHMFNLSSSCPNGILLFMEGFVLPPSQSIRVLKDNDIICVKRKGLALTEAIEGENTCNLLEELEVNRRDPPADNGMILLANEEFDKETGGYKSEFEDVEEEKSEDEPSPKEKASKKRKASSKIQSSRKKIHRLVVMDDEVATSDDNIGNDESVPMKKISKKIKRNKEKKSGESETNTEKVNSPTKVKRKKKHRLGVVSGDGDEIMTVKIENDNNGESILKKVISKKKIKPNEETNKANAEIKDENMEEVKQTSTEPYGAKKGPSRSARRKKAKRHWRRENAKILQNPDTNLVPEVTKAENKEPTNGHSEELLNEDQVPVENVHTNMIKQEERNSNGNGDAKFVPYVVRPGHIRFEPLDQDEDAKPIKVPDVAFQWNGITSKKKGQKWGLETFSISRRDESRKETEEPSTLLAADTQVPLLDLIDFDQLPMYTSPQEDDVIAYRVLELTSSWTPELSSFRVGKISHYDGDNVVLMPLPECPVVSDKMDEDGPDNSLYKEDGSLEIKFAALADVRSVKQSKPDAIKAVDNGINQTPQGDEDKNAAIIKTSSSNDNKENVSKDPSQVKKEFNTLDELEEALTAKKSELMEIKEETKRDSGKNKWSYRSLRRSALGPTMALLRSKNDI